ncbi:MAG: sigma-70 family RNA polymerase sigma factor [Actinobacteria bacterium]|nr:sigma-70 family RNA polymerase sigma factor [Actinomycetota bacterium]
MTLPLSGGAKPTVEELVALFRSEYEPMLRVAFLLLGSQPAAEDVVQDAYAALFERWNRVERPGAYLRRCAVNRCYDQMRRRKTEHLRRVALAEPEAHDQQANELLDVLDGLPAKQRVVVILRYYDGLALEDIAVATRWPIGTVKSLHHRAMATLRTQVER